MHTPSARFLDPDFGPVGTARLALREASAASPAEMRATQAARAEARQKAGRRMIVAGFAITIVGVVLYCAVCFSGGVSAGMDDLLLRNAVPFARSMLAVLGLGTLVWLVGSFTYLRGAMDADAEANEPAGPPSCD